MRGENAAGGLGFSGGGRGGWCRAGTQRVAWAWVLLRKCFQRVCRDIRCVCFPVIRHPCGANGVRQSTYFALASYHFICRFSLHTAKWDGSTAAEAFGPSSAKVLAVLAARIALFTYWFRLIPCFLHILLPKSDDFLLPSV